MLVLSGDWLVCVVVDAAPEVVVVLVCMVDGAVLVSVTRPVDTDVVVVTLSPGTTVVETVVGAIVVAWETLFWMEAALGLGTGTTVGSWASVDEREELASEAALLREELAWDAWALREELASEVAWLSEELTSEAWALIVELACEAGSLAVPVARNADVAAADGAMVMAVEGRETLEGSWREVV